jgi:hypothetical protein
VTADTVVQEAPISMTIPVGLPTLNELSTALLAIYMPAAEIFSKFNSANYNNQQE